MGIDTSKGHPAMDYEEHTRTYDGFVKVTAISTAAVIAVLVGMALFLV